MIELMFAIMLQVTGRGLTGCNCIFISNLSNNTLPWNTTVPSDPKNSPNIIKQNIPWFFPLIIMVLLVMTDYTMGIKKGVDTKITFWGVAFAYTVLSYITVVGNLSTSNYFFLFEVIMITSLIFMNLFKQQGAP